MKIFDDEHFSDAYELIDVLKETDIGGVALVYDKLGKEVCVLKEQSLQSLRLYQQ